MNEETAVAERPRNIEIGGIRYYGESSAAAYLGLKRDTFKKHAKRRAASLPYLVQPATGHRHWTEETLDKYRDEWLTPQPVPVAA